MRTNCTPTDNLFLGVKAGCARLTRLAAAKAQQETGVHGAQALALLTLSEQGAVKITHLAKALDLKKAAASTLVSRLEAEGLLSRGHDDRDARAAVVELTPLGEQKALQVGAMIAGFDETLQTGLSQSEIEVVRRFFSRIMVLEEI
jgi:DNA-binding MarR family transcriptional regulator